MGDTSDDGVNGRSLFVCDGHMEDTMTVERRERRMKLSYNDVSDNSGNNNRLDP